MTREIDGKEVSDEAAQFYDRVKAGERIEQDDVIWVSDTPVAELMHAGLIETQALVWETRVCYVLTGTDPRHQMIADVIRDYDQGDTFVYDELADKILAVLK